MFTGMMWLIDDPKRPLADELQAAMDYYFKKYGRTVEVCRINPFLAVDVTRIGKVQIVPDKSVFKCNLWIGMEEKVHVGQ